MPNNNTPWTDVVADSIAGMKDYWLISEGPTLTVDASGVLNLTAGYHNIVGEGSVHEINGAQRNGQFAVLRIGEGSNIQFVPGGNLHISGGLRSQQRWMHICFRDGFWEEQALSLGDFSSGVIAFDGRTGNVVPLRGDYDSEKVTVTSDPTGRGGTDTQAVLENLNADIEAIESSVIAAGYVKSFAGRKNDVIPVNGDYQAAIVPITPFTVSSTTIPGPSTQEALQQIVAAIGGVAPGGVLSFNARTGNVVPASGDYTAALVRATDPTGYGGLTTQAVLDNLNTKIENSGGGSSQSGIVYIDHALGTFGPTSQGYPTWTIQYGQITADLVSSRAIVNYGGITNSIAAGSVFDQIAALAYREGYSILHNGSLAQNSAIRQAASISEALATIPDEILTAGSVTPTIRGAWTFSNNVAIGGTLSVDGVSTFDGNAVFNGTVDFNGTVTGISGRVEIEDGSTSSIHTNVGGGNTVYGNASNPPAGTGWFQIGFVIDSGSDGAIVASHSGSSISATCARDSAAMADVSGHAVYARYIL
jgi:hypothetical protein